MPRISFLIVGAAFGFFVSPVIAQQKPTPNATEGTLHIAYAPAAVVVAPANRSEAMRSQGNCARAGSAAKSDNVSAIFIGLNSLHCQHLRVGGAHAQVF